MLAREALCAIYDARARSALPDCAIFVAHEGFRNIDIDLYAGFDLFVFRVFSPIDYNQGQSRIYQLLCSIIVRRCQVMGS